MFYDNDMEKAFRFGDVLKGYITTTPSISAPFLNQDMPTYSIDIKIDKYYSILSPCCSIGDKMISLAPLIKIKNSFINNPYLAEDLTRINRMMKPQQSVSDAIWDRFSPEEKQKRITAGKTYALVEFFIYAENTILPSYELDLKNKDNMQTGYYMIDFRDVFKIRCDAINRAKDAPFESKVLQLSTHTRGDLYGKIAFYYGGRNPDTKI